MSPERKRPTPELLFEAVNGFQRSASIRGAIDIDLFTAIGEGADTPTALANRCAASERGLRILSDFLVTIGILTKSEGRYALTAESAAFLDRRSPTCLATLFQMMLGVNEWDNFRDLAAVVRKGGTISREEGIVAPDSPHWVEFARAFARMDQLSAELLADHLMSRGIATSRILDIAAGHGLWGIAIAKRDPLTRVVAVDWPKVVQVARANAAAAGLEGRYDVVEGDAFNVDLGTGYDAVLVTNFLPLFEEAKCTRLLRRVHDALNDGGWVVILEVVPNEDRVTPPVPAQFALTLLAGTPSGDVYTFADFSRMLRLAGFQSSEISPLSDSVEHVIISQK